MYIYICIYICMIVYDEYTHNIQSIYYSHLQSSAILHLILHSPCLWYQGGIHSVGRTILQDAVAWTTDLLDECKTCEIWVFDGFWSFSFDWF